MNLHEFQAKGLFADYGIPVPAGRVVSTVAEAEQAALALGGDAWVVKAQVHAGGRGKVGGVRLVKDRQALVAAVDNLLGTTLVTHQSGPEGQPVNQVLVEAAYTLERELYLSALVDRSRKQVVLMASATGGMDIEAVAQADPEAILRVAVAPVVGLQPYQCRQIAFGLGLGSEQGKQLARVMQGVYRLFGEADASLVEINPLVVTSQGQLLALDAKINLDENALYRHPQLQALRDATQEEAREHRARQHGLNYVHLDGNIGCMVNGAGLAMATMDLIQFCGGRPANFLDVGGGTDADRVAEAFKLILSDPKVAAILVNIFGGIVRCDLIAEGILKAVASVGVEVPMVVRLEGTNAEAGRQLLAESGLGIAAAADLTAAAEKAVAAAAGRA